MLSIDFNLIISTISNIISEKLNINLKKNLLKQRYSIKLIKNRLM